MDIATGKIIVSVGQTRTEDNYAAFLDGLFLTESSDTQWRGIADNLNTHKSEAVVRIVARHCGVSEGIGQNGESGIFKSMETRSNFLRDQNHRITFHFTPEHAPRINQIEIWFSILIRKALKRASFKLVAELRSRIESFIACFNETLAKPFRWTRQGRPLTAYLGQDFSGSTTRREKTDHSLCCRVTSNVAPKTGPPTGVMIKTDPFLPAEPRPQKHVHRSNRCPGEPVLAGRTAH